MENNVQIDEQVKSSGMGVTALILGIISLVLVLIPAIPYILAILAIIFGSLGKNRPGKGMAITGIVTGIITLALKILFWIGVASLYSV